MASRCGVQDAPVYGCRYIQQIGGVLQIEGVWDEIEMESGGWMEREGRSLLASSSRSKLSPAPY